jgi:hypothetical protein
MRADNPHASITEQAALLSEQWKAMPEAAKERYRLHAPHPLPSQSSPALLCIVGYIRYRGVGRIPSPTATVGTDKPSFVPLLSLSTLLLSLSPPLPFLSPPPSFHPSFSISL